MYSALEPQLRRTWPELLISWSRFVSGDVRDPMIGRDILMGALCGTVAYTVATAGYLIPHWLMNGPIPPMSHYFRWDGFLPGLADSASWLTWALSTTLSITFIMFIVLFLTRRRWVAIAAIVGFYTFLGFGPSPAGLPLGVALLTSISVAALALVSLVRFGMVGLVLFQLLFVTLANRPFIFNPQSIYFEVSIAGALVILAIVAYGFFVSLGGARFDLGRLLDGSPQG